MERNRKTWMVADEMLLSKIYIIKNKKVMLDEDLALLYRVETKRLNEQVKRNTLRFPADFMFQISRKEFEDLKSQNATSSWGGRRKLPMAFTEQGVAMLSSVLNREIAIRMNICIVRVFTKMREVLMTHKDILLQLEKMEAKLNTHDEDISTLFACLKQLLNPPVSARRRIGFRRKDEEQEL
jgi:hypothetical protein